MDTLERIRQEALSPRKTDDGRPCLGIVVPPSPFTVPEGWEFVLRRPFEGVSYIATVLHNAGYRIKIIDVRWIADPVNAALEGTLEGVDVLGIATYEDSFLFLEEFLSRVKQKHPGMLTILGGSLVTSVPQIVMENTRADIAVLGEGELTVLELMDRITKDKIGPIEEVPGLCYKNNSGGIIFNQRRPQMQNLNSLPTMNFSLWPEVHEKPRIKEIFFSHSRGCYRDCSFCYRTTPRLSLKSIDKFRNELRELKGKHQFEFIYFVDLTFAIDKERAIKICEVLKEFNIRWSCMCRAENLNKEILTKMKEAGCQIILYGFESLDQDILDKAHKGISPAEIRMMVGLTQEAGIQVGGLFILGLPGETPGSLNKVLEFINDTGSACRVKYLSAIPGTEIYRLAVEKGIIKNEVQHLRWLSKERGQSDDEFINFTDLPDQELRRICKEINSNYIKGPRVYEDWF